MTELTGYPSKARGEGRHWRTELQVVGIVLLDILMSVAAAVVLLLLVTSGDIETNPGPHHGIANIVIACIII